MWSLSLTRLLILCWLARPVLARRAAFLQQERKKHKDLLLFDAGDFSQGTPFYNLFKGEVEIRLMNHMKYDACAIGNHEFDFGLEIWHVF